MNALLASTVAAALLSTTPTTDDRARTFAAEAEARAFTAVDEQRWCDAVALFAYANDLAPAPALLDNAAQAAELADDRVAAHRLLTAAIAVAPAAAKKPLKQRLAVVDKKRKQGPGTACPVEAVAVTPPTVAPPTTSTTPEPPTTETTTATTTTTDATPPPALDDEVLADPPVAAFAVGGVGGVLVVGGAVALALGAQPWFAHADAGTRLQTAEDNRAVDDAALADQAQARRDWNSHGQLLTAVGAGAVVAGVVAGAVGLTLYVLGSE